MLIRGADIWRHGPGDVRIEADRIAAIGTLQVRPGEAVIEAHGGLLVPGLHDHHIHLAGLAVRGQSVVCGPPEVTTREELARRLVRPGKGWLRGILYHESVLGALPDARALDALIGDRPFRMQHRSGRMWLLNSAALEALLAKAPPPPGLEREAGRFTGRLFDEDAWLRRALESTPPDFTAVSRDLAARGVTGMTDMTPQNDPPMAAHFAAQIEDGHLLQRCTLAGTLALGMARPGSWRLGPVKLHLHEAALPDFSETVCLIAAAHDQERGVAVHCVSEVELVFALAALEEAGARAGDRIEHASITPPELAGRMAALGLWACVQPHFVAERGDRYIVDVEPRHIPDLYRLRSLDLAGLPLAGGSDAPFAASDPWAAMAAAVSRRTGRGASLGPDEALTPERALRLYLAAPEDFTRERTIAVGETADLCLIDRPWQMARADLADVQVRASWVSGRIVHDSVDQPPFQRLAR